MYILAHVRPTTFSFGCCYTVYLVRFGVIFMRTQRWLGTWYSEYLVPGTSASRPTVLWPLKCTVSMSDPMTLVGPTSMLGLGL